MKKGRIRVDTLAQAIPNLSIVQLHALAMDAEQRIGSHVAGGMPVEEYVERQRRILTLVQDEIVKRN